jgi:hypothetical protein
MEEQINSFFNKFTPRTQEMTKSSIHKDFTRAHSDMKEIRREKVDHVFFPLCGLTNKFMYIEGLPLSLETK